MEIDTKITLDDNSTYVLLDETKLNNKKYFFAVKLDKNENPTTEHEIFEEEIENDDIYMNALEEGELKEQIFIEFTNNYINNIKDMEV